MSKEDIHGVDFDRLSTDFQFTMYTMESFYAGHHPNVFTKPHRLHFNAVIYISEGYGEHHIDHKVYRFNPGTIMFISRHQIHHFDFNPDVKGYVIPFDDNMLHLGNDDPCRIKIKLAFEEVNFINNLDQDYGFYFEQLWQEFNHYQDVVSSEIIRSIMRTLMLKTLLRYYQSLSQSQSRSPGALELMQLKELIETHYKSCRKVADYAGMMGKTTKKINSIAKENSGRTAKELIDDRVMLEAKRLLAYTQYSIVDIALILGFNEATNMTKFFRRHTELTSKEFRDLCRFNARKAHLHVPKAKYS